MNIGIAEAILKTVNEITTGKEISTRVSGGVKKQLILYRLLVPCSEIRAIYVGRGN
jgi:hypothetical protein